jgi:hypothetical protein
MRHFPHFGLISSTNVCGANGSADRMNAYH